MKGAFKPTDILHDSFAARLPDTTQIKKEFASLKDSGNRRFLEVEVDVTHGGYVNKNGNYYTPDGQAKGVISFFSPYAKPVLIHHDGGQDPVGRTYAGSWIPLPGILDVNTKDDTKTPKCKIRVKSIITDSAAIEKILDKRYLTVSVGGVAKETPKCSICDNLVDSEECTHLRGHIYEGKQCFWKIGEVDYKEYSFENMPADSSTDHVAAVVSMHLTESDVATTDVHGFAGDGAREAALAASLKDSINADKPGGKSMDQKLIDEIIQKIMFVIDECEDCGEDTSEWKDAAEITQAEELGKEFDQIMDVILGDAKLTAEQRKNMKSETFCGPNRSFPVPDCKHASVAMAYLGNPRVQEKYSSSVRARIASCVRSKAKTLNCPTFKAKSSGDTDMQQKLTDATTQVTTLTAENTQLKSDLQVKDAQLSTANTQLTEMHTENKKQLVEKLVDISIIAHCQSVKDIISESNPEERKKKYDAVVTSLMTRTVDSLKDSINDVHKEVTFDVKDFYRVGDPTITEDKKKIQKTETGEVKTELGKRLFK
jgi:hypothetical protein